jgi:hypothetical protein
LPEVPASTTYYPPQGPRINPVVFVLALLLVVVVGGGLLTLGFVLLTRTPEQAAVSQPPPETRRVVRETGRSESAPAAPRGTTSAAVIADLFEGTVGLVLLLALLLVGLLLYATPSFIAFMRGHHQRFAILALNLLVGWSFLGWVASLVWSLTETRSQSQHIHIHQR